MKVRIVTFSQCRLIHLASLSSLSVCSNFSHDRRTVDPPTQFPTFYSANDRRYRIDYRITRSNITEKLFRDDVAGRGVAQDAGTSAGTHACGDGVSRLIFPCARSGPSFQYRNKHSSSSRLPIFYIHFQQYHASRHPDLKTTAITTKSTPANQSKWVPSHLASTRWSMPSPAALYVCDLAWNR